MKYPKYLTKNGTIGFVAPSYGCNEGVYKAVFLSAQEAFAKLGYQMVFGPNCYAGEGVGISNTPEKCAAEFMEAYQSGDSDVLISCGGGELMCEILKHLDWETLKKADPKWFMGYSDNTNLTYLLATICDTASVYGPCAGAFGMKPWHPAIGDALGVLTGELDCVHGYDKWERESLKNEENPCAPYHVTEQRVTRSFIGYEEVTNAQGAPITMSGRLIGGCTDCLVNLIGTRFDHTTDFLERYKEDGFIWFLEACELNVFSIRRAMWQMEQAGWFRYVKGFLIGRPRAAIDQEMMGLDAYRAVLAVAGEKNVPVIMDVDLGHLSPMMPVIVGSVGEVTVSGNDISIRYLKK